MITQKLRFNDAHHLLGFNKNTLGLCILVFLCSMFFFSCDKHKPEEIRAERLVCKWEYEKVHDFDFPGGPNEELYTTPPFPGKCEYSQDYFEFFYHGEFTSVVYGSDCSDSIVNQGRWEVNDRMLKIYMSYSTEFNAEILTLNDSFLILKTETNAGKYRIWKFWNGTTFISFY